jgi:hypothetical protein
MQAIFFDLRVRHPTIDSAPLRENQPSHGSAEPRTAHIKRDRFDALGAGSQRRVAWRTASRYLATVAFASRFGRVLCLPRKPPKKGGLKHKLRTPAAGTRISAHPLMNASRSSNPLASSQSFIELRQCRPSGAKKLRTASGAFGAAIDSQNERNTFLACAGDPLASAHATIAALIAPALVPLTCVMATLRLPSSASNTPQVYAPHEPPPCSARPIGLGAEAGRMIGLATILISLDAQRRPSVDAR